ncbi:peroxisomal ATPase Pex1p [[Candida] railenensis]|uniref:Peroxisomal ATPase PEX1 n=1 Tax=[Candida] railenensis TaxID=45579 RepID=A0A9P0VVV8_9ASCO|nr:peroxisomal ATPase Pex1p [[Candida] railenensis]
MDGHRVSISFKPLRSNLLNLPSPLCNLLYNANINIQDVIVEIVSQNASKAKWYAGWSGMTSSSIDLLEIDPIFAKSLNFNDKDKVIINLRFDNFETTQINLEPVSSSDWELVELHAQILEDKLLSQSRCVSLNQVLVVYPSQTTSARLIVTDIGSKDHKYAKISPACEVAIAPKVREKDKKQSQQNGSSSSKSTKSVRSTTGPSEDYANLPSVLERGISLPHHIYSKLPEHSNVKGYEVYVNFREVVHSLNNTKYVAVGVIPGPLSRSNTVDAKQPQGQQAPDAQDKPSIKENVRIIAKLVNYSKSPPNTVGLSPKLAIALGCENEVGNVITLQPAISPLLKRPSTLTIHPYIVQTGKKSNQINLNSSSKKEQDQKLIKSVLQHIVIKGYPITNFTKLPIISDALPQGGLLRFKRNDDLNSWIKPISDESKLPKFEIGEELLRNESFIQRDSSQEKDDEHLVAVGLEKMEDDILSTLTSSKNSGSLVYGNSGSGKSLMLRIIGQKLSAKFGVHVKFISCESIMNENFQNLANNHILKWLQECSWHKPSLLILDNVEKLLSAEQEHTDSTQSNQLTEFLISQLQKIHNQRNSNLSVLMSSTSKEALNKLLSQSHLIEHFYHLSAPDKGTRNQILQSYLVENLNCDLKFDIMDVVTETEGYLPNDLKVLSDRIFHEAMFNTIDKASEVEEIKGDDKEGFKLPIEKSSFEKALSGYTPSNLRGVKLQKSSINWSDIGGLTEAKNILLETLEWPTKYAPIFANCPLRLRSGILLYGYPGCGKTLLASAIAGQCGLNFISIKGPEILNKYIGASEQSVRELFERAQSAKPCILFFDEFDSIAPKRGHDSTGVTDRVVNQMLTQMDGAEGLDGVYVLAATSRPDLIDSALLRPGRLDKSVICDMPNYDDRLDILKTITSKMDLSDDVDLEDLARRTGGFSGADMQGLGYNAYLKAVHVKLDKDEKAAQENTKNKTESELSADQIDFFQVNSEKIKNARLRPTERVQLLQQIKNYLNSSDSVSNESEKKKQTEDDSSSLILITQHDFEESLKETKPSISASEMKKLSGIYSQFVSGRDGNMPNGTPSSEIGGRTTLM